MVQANLTRFSSSDNETKSFLDISLLLNSFLVASVWEEDGRVGRRNAEFLSQQNSAPAKGMFSKPENIHEYSSSQLVHKFCSPASRFCDEKLR